MAQDHHGTGRYPLAAVRTVRAHDEHGKRGELAAALGAANDSRTRLDAARSRTQAARDAVSAALAARLALVTRGATASMIASAEQYVLRRRGELEGALGEELRCETADGAHQGTLDIARQRHARARVDRELVDRHFERWRTAKKQLAERRED